MIAVAPIMARGDRLESVAGGTGALVSMSRFLGRSGWVLAVAIAALVAVPEGVRAQRTPQPPSPIIASELTIDELFRQGDAAREAGRFTEAEKIFRTILLRDPNNTVAYRKLGNALYDQGKFEEAIAQFRQAIALDPKDVKAYHNLGLALYGQGKLEEAIAQFRQAIALDPKFAHAYYNLGNALGRQWKLEAAIAQYRQAIALDPKFAKAYNNLGNALSNQGKFEEAIAQYRQALALPDQRATPASTHTLAYTNLGYALEQQGNLEAAITEYEKAVALDPKYARAQSKLRAARETLAARRNPPGKDATAYNSLGLALSDQGKLEEAIAQYHQALTLDPKYAAVYHNLGNALRDQGKLEEAIVAYKRGIALNPPDIQMVYNALGYTLEQQGNLEAAIAQYEKAVAFDPTYARAQNNLRAARETLAARRSPPVLDDLAFVPSPERNPKVALFRATVIVEASFGATGQDAGGLNRGAGWVVKREGNTLWIVTCRHNVIDRLDRLGKKLTVEFYSQLPPGQRRKTASVEMVRQDATLDLAVLKASIVPIDIKPLVMAEEEQIQPTGNVMAIGHPYDRYDSWFAPPGNLSEYDRQSTKFSFNAAITIGHSGGPVFDENDRLIGMVTAVSDEYSTAPDSTDPNPLNLPSTRKLARAIRIQPIREKLQAWGILP